MKYPAIFDPKKRWGPPKLPWETAPRETAPLPPRTALGAEYGKVATRGAPPVWKPRPDYASRLLASPGEQMAASWDRYAPDGGKPAPTPPPPIRPGTHRSTLRSISQILRKIEDPTAKAWAEAVFNVYRDWTPSKGIRTTEEQAMFDAQLGDLFNNVPEAAQLYASALQRLVVPSVSRPEQEWYEMPEAQRTSPANWRALGLRANPMWF